MCHHTGVCYFILKVHVHDSSCNVLTFVGSLSSIHSMYNWMEEVTLTIGWKKQRYIVIIIENDVKYNFTFSKASICLEIAKSIIQFKLDS